MSRFWVHDMQPSQHTSRYLHLHTGMQLGSQITLLRCYVIWCHSIMHCTNNSQVIRQTAVL